MTRLWTKQDVADRLGVSISTLERMDKRGEIPKPVIHNGRGGTVRYNPDDFSDLKEKKLQPASTSIK